MNNTASAHALSGWFTKVDSEPLLDEQRTANPQIVQREPAYPARLFHTNFTVFPENFPNLPLFVEQSG
jgi:hypothetical protein